MEFIFCFFVGAIVSFVGSLQPGPVNMAVLYHATRKQYSNALYTAIGGSVPELLFSFVAFKFFVVISKYIQVINQFSYVLDLVFIIIGIALILKGKNTQTSKSYSTIQGFLSGFLLASFNPQLLVFWLAIITSLSIHQIQFDTNGRQIAFAIGTMIGAFLLHVILLYTIKQNANNRLVKWLETRSTQIIGVVLVLVGSFHFIFNYSI